MNAALAPLVAQLNQTLLGKPQAVKLGVTCLLAGGHLLLEDRPGVGKTLFAHSLAQAAGLAYKRVQFTSDLLPSDITGGAIYIKAKEVFEFRAGPVFSQVLLADEINRAPSKTQSALLQAMEEGTVSVDGESHPLPQPFFVLATQNPQGQTGTFPLPESQLDRFLMSLTLGLPDAQTERQLLAGINPRAQLASLSPCLSPQALFALQAQVAQVNLSEAVLDYLQALIKRTRNTAGLSEGLSPRGALALAQATRAYALLMGRSYAVIDDVQAVFVAVARHRLGATTLACEQLLNTTPIA